MRKVVVSEFVSLDGVIEKPSWTFRFTGEEQQKFKFDELSASDELRLMVFPIIVGSGQRHFADGIDEMVLGLLGTETFGSGVVVLTYRSAGKEVEG